MQVPTLSRKLLVTAQLTVVVREPIVLSASVKHKVALVDEAILATVELFYGSDKKTYLDGVDITLSVKSNLVTIKEETKSFAAFTKLLWAFQLNNTSPSTLTVRANNVISEQVQELPVIAVESVGQVKLAFDLPSLSVERNQLWLQLFEESIRQQLLQLLGFESWVLRVSAEAITPDTGTTDVETIVATVTVLPASSSAQDQADGQKHVEHISAVSKIGHSFSVPEINGLYQPYLYTVSVGGLAVGSAPGTGAIAGIVVAAVIVIVAMAVGLGAVIFLLYRKYRRLEVRYSRLATSGVTFDPSSDDEEPVEVAPTESETTSTGVTVFLPTHPPDPDQ